MNGTKDSITELSKILTTGPLDPNVEVNNALKIADYVTKLRKLSIFFSLNFSSLGRRWMSVSFHFICTRIASSFNWCCWTGKLFNENSF